MTGMKYKTNLNLVLDENVDKCIFLVILATVKFIILTKTLAIMDVLKQKLNDIGSCIRYPFYFFEDGSFSHTFVCGKMNACLMVKGAFAESDKCFFASDEVASISGIKAMEKSWAEKSVVPQQINWFKKYLNDIGVILHYPFYVFDDGSYAKTATLGSKQAVLHVKQPFTSVEGDSTFYSPDRKRVWQFDEDLKKIQRRKTELPQIMFRMLAERKISDDEMLLVIESGRFDMFPNYAKIYKCSNSDVMYARYPKSFMMLAKIGRWDILEMFGCRFLDFLPASVQKEVYRIGPLETLNYFWKEELEHVFELSEYRMFRAGSGYYYYTEPGYVYGYRMPRTRSEFTEPGYVYGYPQVLIERGDIAVYHVYRHYVDSMVRKLRWSGKVYFACEFPAILKFNAVGMLAVLLQFTDLTPEDQGNLVASGNLNLIRMYVQVRGLHEHFRQLLLYSGNDELVKLANQPEPSTHQVSQEDKVSQDGASHANMVSEKSGGLFQKIRKFFSVSA